MKIKISEIFYSLQGEGRFVGVPSVFLRTFGCNFTCAGFGMPRDQKSTEADDIAGIVQFYTSFNELPLVETGCDSYASWHTSFKHLSPNYETEEVVDKLLALTPNNKWVQKNGNDVHLVITGGEPLLGWQRAYTELLEHPKMSDLKNVTFETNGSQKLSVELIDYLIKWKVSNHQLNREITFSVSPKLSCSGEDPLKAIRPEIVASYQHVGHTYLKFVVETEEHVDEAIKTVDKYRAHGFTGSVFLMPQGGVVTPYSANKINIANICCERGFNYSPRLHVDLWGNGWGK
jgi:7-carboxy-7-deazaguanine synthase